MRHWASILQDRPRGDVLECGLRWAVEARRKKKGQTARATAASKARGKDRTGTEQARQASAFRRRTTAGEDGSGKRKRARGDRVTDRPRKYRPRPRGRRRVSGR